MHPKKKKKFKDFIMTHPWTTTYTAIIVTILLGLSIYDKLVS